ncbi:hypothetical protein BOTBODRAFT_104109 [Botryobasidium botryosum FD-172 SS1]|uniref:histone deacetylase n=1 Tax=Botryobasidium botryosum (strain FD-172 SS1) TaxID=930990 RepID=A0A067MSH3_BOTB1|nr:hypothetical protein BOTBODRAFT_104109 [Botryobasidium botryosum FD-172 SS1]
METSGTRTFSSRPQFASSEDEGMAQPYDHFMQPHSNPVVSYYFPKGVGNYHYGERHPMKPHRLTLTNSLVIGYGLHKKIDHFFNPRAATQEELEQYHDHDYIDFLARLIPGSPNIREAVERFNFGEDCPLFDGLFDFCSQYTGASLMGARKISQGTTDIAINWSGGLHHAKRGEASGFCYVNDAVIAILEMLRFHPRVLYIDIDIHHGDGVELAFWNTNRVMTVSFHKYNGDFFPGTGKLEDDGGGLGKHFCLNIPLQDGIDDESYVTLFKSVMEPTITAFQPSSIVLQCGADSLGCDRLGAFNLSISAHGECVRYIKAFNLPLLVVGGGGYTVRNVSRCWTYETSLLVGAQIPEQLPHTPYDAFFAPDHALHPKIVGKVDNQNTRASLERIRVTIREKLRYLNGAPSVQMSEIPPELGAWLEDEYERKNEDGDEEQTRTDGRPSGDVRRQDPRRRRNEFYDAERDGERNRDVPAPAMTRRSARGRGRASRGRSRNVSGGNTRGDTGADGEIESIAEEDEESPPTPGPPARGRRGGRGRRGKGRSSVAASSIQATPATESTPLPPPDANEVDV